MKVYSIGREVGCDITINDSTDVISRRHATLNVYPSGKMTIIDSSHNGTYVNGIRISSNVPVPVTRKDNISFAHIARLDWNSIPNPQSTVIKYVAIGVAALIVVVGAVFFGMRTSQGNGDGAVVADSIMKVDSSKIDQNVEKLKNDEERARDSINKVLSDSIKNLNKEKAKADSIKKAEDAARKAKATEKKKDKQDSAKDKKKETKKDTPKKEQDKENAASKERRFS